MKKHAYLIMAHQNFKQLKILINLLDYENNDIYIHVDKKTIVDNELFSGCQNVVKKSKVYFITNRIKVNWGGGQCNKSRNIVAESSNKGQL